MQHFADLPFLCRLRSMKTYLSFMKLLHLYCLDVIDRENLESMAATLLSQKEGLTVGAQGSIGIVWLLFCWYKNVGTQVLMYIAQVKDSKLSYFWSEFICDARENELCYNENYIQQTGLCWFLGWLPRVFEALWRCCRRCRSWASFTKTQGAQDIGKERAGILHIAHDSLLLCMLVTTCFCSHNQEYQSKLCTRHELVCLDLQTSRLKQKDYDRKRIQDLDTSKMEVVWFGLMLSCWVSFFLQIKWWLI